MKAYRNCLERSVHLTAGLILMGAIAVQAADVSEYGVLKGKKYIQTEAGTPGEEFSYYWWSAFAQMSAAGTVTTATAQPPGFPGMLPLFADGDPTLLQFETIGGLTVADLNATFPNGNQLITMNTMNDGNRSVTLSLTGDSYPNIPSFLNFAALETVDPSEAFALSWSGFSGGTANDFILVRILDDYSSMVFTSPAPGKSGALNGASTSLTIPAGTLSPESNYTALLTFVKVADLDTSTYPGAIGLAGYYKNTQTSLETTGGSGGGDTTPPELASSNPPSGQFDVDVNSTITFVFNEPMADAQSIAWSANITPADFIYSWSGNGRTLTCTYIDPLPSTALISWQLNPSGQPQNFEDEAGNPLPQDTYYGSFFTAAGTNNLCGMEDDGRGAGGIIKELIYVQNSTANPVPDPDDPAVFFGSVVSPTNDPVSSAKLQVPGGSLLTLTNLTGFGSFFMANESYPSQSALDTARPNGIYNLQLTRTSGAMPSANISLSGIYPPTPKIQNYTACQTVDPATDFAVQWNGFAGASEGDYVSISILHPTTFWSWSAPDRCIPRDLANTATSVVIPAGTFEPGITYEASLVYSRLTHGVSNAIPDIDTIGYLHKTVHFTIQTTGSTVNGARFISWRLLPSGNLELQLEGAVGLTYAIKTTDDLLGGWSIVTAQTIPFDGVAVFEVSTSDLQAFFRAEPL